MYYANGEYPYANTYTATGHATLATGAPVLAFGTALEGRSPLMTRLAASLSDHGEGLDLAVADGAAGAILLRPATVAQIRHVAETRTRMPAKTTFFWPKPRSGMVYRPLDA